MANLSLRFTLLKIVDHLNDNDRAKLHFILGDHLPRRLRDDLSHGGTLFLMESLLDQGRINDNNLNLLINALKAIRRDDMISLLAGRICFLN